MDLAAIGEVGVLLEHLPFEGDEKAAVLMIRRLGAVAAARPMLAALRDDPKTPVRVYHAAVSAHDRLERVEGA
jgi:hypothetical protein